MSTGSLSTVAELRAVILERLDDGDTALDSIERDGPTAIRTAITAQLAPLGIDAAAREALTVNTIALLQRAVEHGRKTTAVQRRLTQSAGDTSALDAAAAMVALSITSPAADLAPLIGRESLDAIDPARWSAAEQTGYTKAADGQGDAVARVAEVGREIEEALRAMSTGIENFYSSLAQLVMSAVVAVIGLAATLATWEAVSGGIAALVSSLVGIGTGLAALSQQALADSRAVEGRLRAIDQVAWPKGAAL